MIKSLCILLTWFTFLLSSDLTNLLSIKSNNSNRTKLIFEFNENQFNSSVQSQPMSYNGLPLYSYVLEVHHESSIRLDYEIKNIVEIDYNYDHQIVLGDISKNQEKIEPVFISKEFEKNNKKYIVLSISPFNISENLLYSEIVIYLNHSIYYPVEIIDNNEAAEILSRNINNTLNPVLLIIAPDGENIYNLMTPFINWKKTERI